MAKPRRIEPISQSELATRKGCSRQAVSKQIKGALRIALLDDGLVDAGHPAVVEWLKPRTAHVPTPPPKPAVFAPAIPTTRAKPGRPALQLPTEEGPTERIKVEFPDDGTPAAMDRILDAEVVGKIIRLRDYESEGATNKEALGWTDLKKRIEEVRKLRLDNDETEGKIIHRDGVITHVMGLVDLVFNRLLGDVPRTLTSTISAAAKSGSTAEEIEKTVRGVISSVLRDLKTSAIKRLLGK
jgi:hypothetical protein